MTIDKHKNKQVLLTLTNELLEQVEQYWHEHKLPNRNEAIRNLIAQGLKHPSTNQE